MTVTLTGPGHELRERCERHGSTGQLALLARSPAAALTITVTVTVTVMVTVTVTVTVMVTVNLLDN